MSKDDLKQRDKSDDADGAEDDVEDEAEPTDPDSSSSELEIPSLDFLASSAEGVPAVPVADGTSAAPAAVVEVPSDGETAATSAETRFTEEDRPTPCLARMEQDSQFPIGYDPVTNPSLSHPELGGGEDMGRYGKTFRVHYKSK